MRGFEDFWAAWPKNTATYTRKGAKAACLKRWAAGYYETQAAQIVAHVRWLSTTTDWLKDGGAFIPAPLVYLNQQRWDGAEIPTKLSTSQTQALFAEMDRARERMTKPPEALLKLVRRA
jgi:hypothetical protein